jgi:hypothetical protein
MPTTLASDTRGNTLAAGLLLFAFLPLRRLRRRGLMLMALLTSLLCAGGCGGGFRTMATTAPGATTRTYSAVVTANTTGVLGDPLTHTTALSLVVTP